MKRDERANRIAGRDRFGPTRRVRAARDFQRVRHGRRVNGRYLSLGYVRRPQREAPFRAGFTVGKRVGGAVVRNRVKRRLRESIRHALHALAPGWDVVLTAKPPAAEASYAALEGEMRELLTQAGLWNAESEAPVSAD